jgi:hypothetical protein
MLICLAGPLFWKNPPTLNNMDSDYIPPQLPSLEPH